MSECDATSTLTTPPHPVVDRRWLGWSRLALDAALDHLAEHRAELGRDAILVTPTRRGGRRLLERLAPDAETPPHLAAMPTPRITTPGQLPEALDPAPRATLHATDALLLRAETLADAPRSQLHPVAPHPPAQAGDAGAEGDTGRAHGVGPWLPLARRLAQLDDLAALQATTVHQLAERVARLGMPREAERWRAIARLQARYDEALALLDRPDDAAARRDLLRRLEHPGAPPPDARATVVLVCPLDLPPLCQRLLAASGRPIQSLIAAPAELADAFDAWGLARPAAWRDRDLTLPEVELRITPREPDQAGAVADAIARLAASPRRPVRHVDDISVVLGDESLAEPVERAIERAGAPCRRSVHHQADQAPAATWLTVATRWVLRRRVGELAALLRHPLTRRWLDAELGAQQDGEAGGTDGVLEALDAWSAEALPQELDRGWPGDGVKKQRVQDAARRLDGLLCEDDNGPPRVAAETLAPRSRWAKLHLRWLGRLVRGWTLRPHDPADQRRRAELETLADVLARAAEPGPARGGPPPRLTLADAETLLRDELAAQPIPPERDSPAIELVGWLEWLLDDAPCAVVTSMNQGVVPAAPIVDPLLPESLRRALAWPTAGDAAARDAYILEAACRARRGTTLLAAQRDREQAPLLLSSLLLRGPDAQRIDRFARFTEDPPRPGPTAEAASAQPPEAPAQRSPAAGPTVGRRRPAFPLPYPRPLDEPIEALTVTVFRDYLACPYRFYLKHVRRLRAVTPDPVELDGSAFGVIAHKVLQQVASDPAILSTDPRPLAAAVDLRLDEQIRLRLGPEPPIAARVQVERLRLRLHAWADWQAKQTEAGWRIEPRLTERTLSVELMVDGRPFVIQGRIDRVDRGPDGAWRVLDYKTRDSPSKPEKTHRAGDRWVDLQLPLYRRLLRGEGLDPPPEVGYLQLPRRPEEVGAEMAEWSVEDYAEAEAQAEEVVRRLRDEAFWPPAEPPKYDDGLARLCADRWLARRTLITLSAPPDAPGPGGAE